MRTKLYIIANWMQGVGLSGADRVFIELAKRWNAFFDIHLCVSYEGLRICQRENLKNVIYDKWSHGRFNKLGYAINYLYRTFFGLWRTLMLKPEKTAFIYSSSDFLPDCLPAFILKMRNKKIKWIAGFYLFAPQPWQKGSPYKGMSFLTGLGYWLTQRPAYWMVNHFADMVFVTSVPDVKKFVTRQRNEDKIVVAQGGVDVGPSVRYMAGGVIPAEQRKYDACFVGRLHPQKGLKELLEAWKEVVRIRGNAKLAIIGSGPLETELHEKMRQFQLQNHVEWLGFKDGQDKYNVFKNSKIVLHPAIYDSGGMAAAEAMAWGLPGVSFDLESLKTYYPKGMLKTKCFDVKEFAQNILRLLNDSVLYQHMSEEAVSFIRKEWDWDKRAQFIYEKLQLL